MDKLLEFFEEIERLKRTPRSGWSYYGITTPESVAEHTFMVAILTLIFGRLLEKEGEKLDLDKAIRMALIHELGETKIGDLHLKAREYLKECVADAEWKAVLDTAALLPSSLSSEITELYKEFEAGTTPEAKLVRALDKVELLIQAYTYTKSGYKNLDKIWKGSANRKFFNYFELINKFIELLDKKGG